MLNSIKTAEVKARKDPPEAVDDVLSGAFPKPGSCPLCGRCD